MKKIIRISAVVLTVALLMSMLGTFALAAGDPNYCYEGWYIVNITKPAGRAYIYLYDQPSSTQGRNLGRVDNGTYAYVYWRETGLGGKTSKWCYCNYDGTYGYIRWDNLMPANCCYYYGY